MDLKKVLPLCVLLVVVFSAVGGVSAGLFDFLGDDKTYGCGLNYGYVYTARQAGSTNISVKTMCKLNAHGLSQDDKNEIENFLASCDRVYFSVTLNDTGETVVICDGEKTDDIDVECGMNNLAITHDRFAGPYEHPDEGREFVKSGKLVLYGKDKTITINFD